MTVGASRSDAWTAEWCSQRLIKHEDIVSATALTGNSVQLIVKNVPDPILIATMAAHSVELNSVPDTLHDSGTAFLLNIPKDACFSGELLTFAAHIPVGVGGVGDLYIAAAEKEFRSYIPKEVRFILRGLDQHSAVRVVTRLNNRSYGITKTNGRQLRVLALNDYDLAAEAIRSGIQKFGKPDLILASNPNCRQSADIEEVTNSIGTRVVMWRQLLGVLNN